MTEPEECGLDRTSEHCSRRKRPDREESESNRCGAVTAHQLRHTYAAMLYDAGVGIKQAQEKPGHKDAETTMGIYTHIG
ncbi:MAG: tyrosine-type recombinase/integrase, partial [Oscillospiraceae bacterium]|nr:tyrosine-type recombinase/integrase [Oscillospiraceae bacterium]